MVHESYPWKQDLLRRKNLLLKYNSTYLLEKNFETSCTVIEKSIFYSAFIIRKLIDCKGKLSDEADSYSIKIKAVKPNKQIDIMHRWPEEDNYEWDKEENVLVKGRDICNWLIHSYVFFFEFDESSIIKSFRVSSDYDKNKLLYEITLQDWIMYIDFIYTDDIVLLSSCYDKAKNDYVYTRKKRSTR